MSVRIGIQGLAASYSDAAILQTAPHAEKMFCESFAEVFDALAAGRISKGFLPFENSTSGFIGENYQLLHESGLFATEEHLHRVEHCLLGPKGSTLADVEVVLSHPQALKQCTRFLREHGLRSEPYFDTAGAARDIARSRGRAAVASVRAAQLYGLEILKQSINDEGENWTRFLTIESQWNWSRRVIISAPLRDFQELMADLQGVQVIALHTQPVPGDIWGHRYYVELATEQVGTWKDFFSKHRGVKMLGSFEGKR